MSNLSPRSRRSQAAGFSGLPTWSGIAIVLAALITGLLLSLNAQQIGWPFLLCFAAAGLVVALLTEVRGLFLTVASLPLMFGVMTVLTSWAVTRSLSVEGSAAFSTTSIVTSVYPLAQFFPVLAGVTVAAAAIGFGRVWLTGRTVRARDAAAIQNRRHTSEADRRNLDTASRARNRANEVTVEELLERNRRRDAAKGEPARGSHRIRPAEAQSGQAPPPPRPGRRRRLDDDLYS